MRGAEELADSKRARARSSKCEFASQRPPAQRAASLVARRRVLSGASSRTARGCSAADNMRARWASRPARAGPQDGLARTARAPLSRHGLQRGQRCRWRLCRGCVLDSSSDGLQQHGGTVGWTLNAQSSSSRIRQSRFEHDRSHTSRYRPSPIGPGRENGGIGRGVRRH